MRAVEVAVSAEVDGVEEATGVDEATAGRTSDSGSGVRTTLIVVFDAGGETAALDETAALVETTALEGTACAVETGVETATGEGLTAAAL